MSLLGKKRPEKETGYFYLNALILGNRAAELAIEHEDPAVIAVLLGTLMAHVLRIYRYGRIK